LPELTTPPLPPGLSTPAPTDRPISVAEAITIALAHQPQVALASSAVAAATGRARQAASALYPSAGISAQHSHADQTGATSGTFGSSGYATSISGNQLIYDFGKTPAQVAQARSQQESARQALAQTRQDVVNQVKQGYYTLLQNQRLVEVQRTNVAAQQAHLDLTRARFTAGVAPRSDVVRTETALASAIFNLASAQNASAVSRVSLDSAMGIDVRTPIMVEESEEPAPSSTSPESLVEQAISLRPEIARLRANLRAAQEAVTAARTTSLPDFVLEGSYGLRGSDFPGDLRSWSYGVSLQWPLFNVGLTKGRVQEAQANLQSAEETLRQGELNVGSEVVQDYLNVQTAGQKVTSAAAEVANAEESARAATGRYQAGVAAYIEVIDAQAALVTARTDQVNALYGLSIARAALARALGLSAPGGNGGVLADGGTTEFDSSP
jgi:TolC family type I secretion outer membrane protein